MGWQDRDYSRGNVGGSSNPLMWLVNGSVPLFTAFGIRVRMHASLVVVMVIWLVLGPGKGYAAVDHYIGPLALFTIILLHEFGHCFAARYVGGSAEDILMTPLGGLAMTRPPHRPGAMLFSTAGGPLVNVAICLVLGGVLFALTGKLPWQPWYAETPWFGIGSATDASRYVYWFYQVSWSLLLFNLLPIFPLDGGRLLQETLWYKFGYYHSMLFATMTGMIASAAAGLAVLTGLLGGGLFLILLAVSGFLTCFQMRRQLLAAGPYAFENEPDYSAAYDINAGRAVISKRRVAKLQRQAEVDRAEARAEQERVDAILEKVSKQGMQALTRGERKALARATENQQKRAGRSGIRR